jgi:hypothetical protein
MFESDSNEAPTPAKKSRRSFTAEKKLKSWPSRLQQARLDEQLLEAANLLEEIDLEQDEESGYASDVSIDLDE